VSPTKRRSEARGTIPPVRPPAAKGHEAGRRGEIVAGLLLVAATLVVYSNTFHASFHLDDDGNIIRNGSLRDLRSLWPPAGSRWLGYLSFALNHRLGGLDVLGYHLVNVGIHACNGLLVFWLVATTLRTPSMRRAEAGPLIRRYLPLAAGLIFAVHPIATQAVTYVVQRFTSLAVLFYLLSLTLYAQARISVQEAPSRRRRAVSRYLLSVVAAAAAMKTKEISFTLPVVIAGYELLFFRHDSRRLLLVVPAAITALLVPLSLAPELARAVGEGPIPRSVYLMTQLRVVVTYVRLLLFPAGQNLDYDFPLSLSLGEPGLLLALAVLLAIAAGAVLLLRRALGKGSAPGVLAFFGVAWFFVTLSIESSVIPISDVIFEHRAYLPSVGGAIAMAAGLLWGVEQLQLRASPRAQCAAALLLTAGPLGIATYARNMVWKDDLTLWSDVVAKSPNKARPHNHLGLALLARGDVGSATREFLTAVTIDPSYSVAFVNLGDAFHSQGRLADAIRAYQEAIRLQPAIVEAHRNLAIVYEATGQLDEAVREGREAIRLAPRYGEGYQDLGMTFYAMGRLDDAARELREAIRLEPSLAKAHNNLGGVYHAMGRLEEAENEFREAIRLDPGSVEARNNLASTKASRRRGTSSATR
jgi:Flp pilus assembly protein TadD